MLFSVALGTALREHEILALNVGDVFGPDGKSRRRVQLRVFKRSNQDEAMQEVVLLDNLRAKLDKLRGWKKRRGESLDDDAPLFVSRNGNRLSARQLRHLQRGLSLKAKGEQGLAESVPGRSPEWGSHSRQPTRARLTAA